MDKLQQISDALNSIENLPDFFKQIQNDLTTHSTRLYYLLYGKDNKYEGPLYNGLEKNEWTMITLLVSNWLVETIHDISPRKYQQNIRKLFYEYNLTQVAIKIVVSFIDQGIFPIDNEDEKAVIITLLNNPQIVNFLNKQLESILNRIQKLCGCFPPRHKTIIQVTNETGNKVTFINSVKSVSNLE
jgi:hypothetical protein